MPRGCLNVSVYTSPSRTHVHMQPHAYATTSINIFLSRISHALSLSRSPSLPCACYLSLHLIPTSTHTHMDTYTHQHPHIAAKMRESSSYFGPIIHSCAKSCLQTVSTTAHNVLRECTTEWGSHRRCGTVVRLRTWPWRQALARGLA
jgi:hypothetical protein